MYMNGVNMESTLHDGLKEDWLVNRESKGIPVSWRTALIATWG